jgi:FemAB-related protein (PEP-CTERM system-associated)
MTASLRTSEVMLSRLAPQRSSALRAWMQTLDDGASAAALAHAPEWFDVIRDAYGHEPLYLAAEDQDGRRAVLPSFIVRRPLGGTVVTSMPFLDSGGPCGALPSLSAPLLERLIREARTIGASRIELRCVAALPVEAGSHSSLPAGSDGARLHKVNMTLALPSDAGLLWRRVGNSVRNQVRKAERSGLTIESGGAEKLAPFYDVFAARMHDLGSPVHGRRFLGAVLESFGTRARVVLARQGSATIGGLIAIRFKDRVAVPWAACLEPYFALCPNMLLYWNALRTACAEGIRHFDFGRSTRGSGTYRFKRQWGAEEQQLFWYTIALRRQRHESSEPRASVASADSFAATAWRHLPLSVTRQLGPHIRKYLTQ